MIEAMKREHSRKPDELYDIIEACSSGPYLELFARGSRPGWHVWGNQSDDYYPTWTTYANHSQNGREPTPLNQERGPEQLTLSISPKNGKSTQAR
mgnify:FL=1